MTQDGQTTQATDKIDDSAVAQPSARPEWFKEDKFWTGNLEESAKKLADSYRELEKRMSQKSPLPTITPDAPPANPFADDNVSVETFVQGMGMTEADIAKAIAANEGKVPDDIYAKARKQGVGKKLFDDIVAQRATIAQQQVEQANNAAVEIAGGQQQLESLFTFAKQLPKTTIDTINSLLANSTTYPEGVRLMRTHYDQAVTGGKVKPLMEGRPGGDASVTPYSTQAEYYAAAKAVGRDPEAKARHEARCKASPGVWQLPAR